MRIVSHGTSNREGVLQRVSGRIAAAGGIASSSHASQAVTRARYDALLGCVLTHYRGDSTHSLRLPFTRCHDFSPFISTWGRSPYPHTTGYGVRAGLTSSVAGSIGWWAMWRRAARSARQQLSRQWLRPSVFLGAKPGLVVICHQLVEHAEAHACAEHPPAQRPVRW